SEDARKLAAAQLVEFRKGEASVATTLLDLISPRTSPTMAQGYLEAIGKSEAREVGNAVVERLPALTPTLRATGLRMLMARAEWTPALLDGLDSGKLQ